MPRFSESELILNPDKSIYHLSLQPENVAENIILVGDPGRVHMVSKYFDKVEFEMNKREFITHTGIYNKKKISVISSGMGTNNVEILMHELDALFNIDFKTREVKPRRKKLKIFRIGTSESIQEDIRIGSHLVSEYAIGLDPILHFYEYQMKEKGEALATGIQQTLNLPFKPYCAKGSKELISRFEALAHKGNTVTCPGFYAPQGRALRIPLRFTKFVENLQYFHTKGIWLTNLDMETAGYYAIGRMMGHETVSLNAIVANRIKKTVSINPNKIVDALIKKVIANI